MISVLLQLFVLTNVIFPIELKQIQEPFLLKIQENIFYITQPRRIHQYTFSKNGMKETNITKLESIKYPIFEIVTLKDSISFFNENCLFSFRMNKLESKTFPFNILNVIPVGEGQVIYESDNKQKKSIVYLKQKGVSHQIYENRDEQIIYYSESQKMSFDLIRDVFRIFVENNRIYIVDSSKGFFIQLFDLYGKKIKTVSLPYDKITIPEKDKQDKIREFNNDPQFIALKKVLKNNIDFKFPKYFPPIKFVEINSHGILVRTYKNKNGKAKIIILSLDGEIIMKQNDLPDSIKDRHIGLYENEIYFLNKVNGAWSLNNKKE